MIGPPHGVRLGHMKNALMGVFIIAIYNATIQNNREIDRVHNYKLYIATVSIKHKSVDRIKTALLFWLNATR